MRTTLECPVEGPSRTCSFYGDPHCETFDGTDYGSGEDKIARTEWLVQTSGEVEVQIAYYKQYVTGVAVGGTFLKGLTGMCGGAPAAVRVQSVDGTIEVVGGTLTNLWAADGSRLGNIIYIRR